MKMKEVCARSGLTEKAVRLYCERGLVHPEKYWERGREYLIFSDHNLRELAVVSELRRAEFSLEEIALMLESPEKCGDVLAGWRGRVTEQEQRLTKAKEKLEELSAHENLSAERLAELLGTKITSHGAAPYKGETFAEFCERGSSYTTPEFSEPMQHISDREEKREHLGKSFLIIYSIVMGLITLLNGALSYASSAMVLPALIAVAMFVVLTVFLFRGAVWARVIAIVRHTLSAFMGMYMIKDFLPGASLGFEHVTNMDGSITVVKQFMPQNLGILITGLLIIGIILEIVCVYMLWFHKGVKDYLYERSL
ncbi:MAG: MerR family transcriptional regulator [Clostridia bacterium]|nr:MerR family transcriptional regulator [Clostridia bacterium]